MIYVATRLQKKKNVARYKVRTIHFDGKKKERGKWGKVDKVR